MVILEICIVELHVLHTGIDEELIQFLRVGVRHNIVVLRVHYQYIGSASGVHPEVRSWTFTAFSSVCVSSELTSR